MAYVPGSGAILKVTIAASPTAVAQISKFGPITKKRARIDVTDLASTLEILKPGIKRFDGLAFEGWWDPDDATQTFLQTSYAGSITEVWAVTEANTGAAAIGFSGWLEDLHYGEHAVDGYVTIGGIIVLTTDITITP